MNFFLINNLQEYIWMNNRNNNKRNNIQKVAAKTKISDDNSIRSKKDLNSKLKK